MQAITIFRLAQRDFEVSWSEIKMFLTLLFNKLTSFLHYTFIDKEKSCFKIFELIFPPSIIFLPATFYLTWNNKILWSFCDFFNHDFFTWKGWEKFFMAKIECYQKSWYLSINFSFYLNLSSMWNVEKIFLKNL